MNLMGSLKIQKINVYAKMENTIQRLQILLLVQIAVKSVINVSNQIKIVYHANKKRVLF